MPSGAGFAVIVVKDELVIACLRFPIMYQRGEPSATVVPGEDGGATFAGGGARATRNQAENEVPQPHDFVAWGFTKTNPCCISVSW